MFGTIGMIMDKSSEKQVEISREDCLQIMFLILGRVRVFHTNLLQLFFDHEDMQSSICWTLLHLAPQRTCRVLLMFKVGQESLSAIISVTP